ncbi:MAG: hypothetical protein QF535_04635 [Anaerolineales bacterium]|jgi:hypothetical protein|nr:hypothetical protein [Anaerolineales bacterium]|tara:strand:+ start:171 stop:413 length:243 start_codon:yes stop_codon:yes gene_type:complete
MTTQIKYMVVDDSGDKYFGTPKQVVCDMRMWDTSMGRCSTNREYMKLVTTRLPELPVYKSEIAFLRKLDALGRIELYKSN